MAGSFLIEIKEYSSVDNEIKTIQSVYEFQSSGFIPGLLYLYDPQLILLIQSFTFQ